MITSYFSDRKAVCKHLAAVCLALFAISFALAQDGESVQGLIEKLGSTNFKTREAATKALLERPEAEKPLREAMHSKDLEFSRRVADIVEKLEWRRSPLRELDKAIEGGRVDRVIELVAAWPEGKDEKALWETVDKLSHALIARANQGAKPDDDRYIPWPHRQPPDAGVKTNMFSEATPVPIVKPRKFSVFVRAEEVDFDGARKGNGRLQMPDGPRGWIVSSGAVRFSSVTEGRVVLAGGSVTHRKMSASRCLILSCGDVKLENLNAGISLIIAKGNVDCSTANLSSCRIIAGKSVKLSGRSLRGCVIEENQPNPLGLIRWSDAPKDKEKAAPKSN